MAFPVNLDGTQPANTENPNLGASRIRAVTQAILDLFNLPSATNIGAALAITRVGPYTNQTGVTLNAGDVVALDLANDASVALSDVQGSLRQFVVALATISSGASGVFGQTGQVTVTTQGVVTRGNYLRKSATTKALEDTGIAQSSTAAAPSGTVGVAVTGTAGPGASTVVAQMFGNASAYPAATVYLDELTGLGLSNSGADLAVAAGAAASDDATISARIAMVLGSALTGKTSGTWVVGNNQTKLDAGTVGNNQTWHVFVIERTDTAVVDILFSQSATAPTLPTNYTKKRRIGAFRTDGSAAILPFVQYADEFYWTTPPTIDVSAANPGTAAVTRTLTVPTGIQVLAIVEVGINNQSTNDIAVYLSSLDTTDVVGSITASPLATVAGGNAAATASAIAQARVWTNTSGQIRSRLSASGASDVLSIQTIGWLDRRGRG